ncbi:MAG: DUF2183 domain-containing protein [Gemmatimonadales bacterium]|nr:DUF2183 domain-containing protein [Gemmatimonadales bacterium]
MARPRLIAELFEAYPGLPFILVGDGAQEDPEIYAEMVDPRGRAACGRARVDRERRAG